MASKPLSTVKERLFIENNIGDLPCYNNVVQITLENDDDDEYCRDVEDFLKQISECPECLVHISFAGEELKSKLVQQVCALKSLFHYEGINKKTRHKFIYKIFENKPKGTTKDTKK